MCHKFAAKLQASSFKKLSPNYGGVRAVFLRYQAEGNFFSFRTRDETSDDWLVSELIITHFGGSGNEKLNLAKKWRSKTMTNQNIFTFSCCQAYVFATVLFLMLIISTTAMAQRTYNVRLTDSGSFVVSPLNLPSGCPSTGPLVLTQDVARGHANLPLLGKYTLSAQEVINLATFEVTQGSFSIIAANGDAIFGTYSGQAYGDPNNPAAFTYNVTGPITGGTGRFAGATGSITFNGSGQFTSATTGTLRDEATATIILP
jgi:hypothetical protein